MMRILVATKAFLAALSSGETAARLAEVLAGPPSRDGGPTSPVPASATVPARSEALTLLTTLQREGRFVDFVQESLEGATDDQIAAVVRDVHRDCAAALERMFAIRPLLDQEEGASVEVPPDFDAMRFRLTGNVQGTPPYRGTLGHHGWQATRNELPKWTGSSDATLVISPADVELSS